MSNSLDHLLTRIAQSRANYLTTIQHLTDEQARWKPAAAEWSILQITEHLVWAEQIGVCGMLNAINALKAGQPIWTGQSPNAGLSIEEVIAQTWQPKEQVPTVAEPRWGGTLQYWMIALANAQHMLTELVKTANSVDLCSAIYPHPISGPLDVIQRLEFLSFHIDRHLLQAQRVMDSFEQ
ncbi:MAG: DinB family protein [Bacteroidota bacterium]